MAMVTVLEMCLLWTPTVWTIFTALSAMIIGVTTRQLLSVGSWDSALAQLHVDHILDLFQISLPWMTWFAVDMRPLFKSVNTPPVITVVLERVQESFALNKYLILLLFLYKLKCVLVIRIFTCVALFFFEGKVFLPTKIRLTKPIRSIGCFSGLFIIVFTWTLHLRECLSFCRYQ